MTTTGKKYFIEVYVKPSEASFDEIEGIAQYEYPTLAAAYDAAQGIYEMYSDEEDFYNLEIVDEEDLCLVYYSIDSCGVGHTHEPEIVALLEERENENAAEKANAEIIACIDDYAVDAKIENAVEITTNENWRKKGLKSTLRLYEMERETLNKYERELTWNLHQAALVTNVDVDFEHRGKIGRCLAELVMAQTEYVNSLKTEIADRLMKLMPKNEMPKNEKTPDCKREMSEMTVKEWVEGRKPAAIRASYSAGLVEQAKSANTEREILDAMANYYANFYTKGYAVSEEWNDAINYFKFKSIAKIVERDERFTVGDYLEIAAKISA